MSYIKKYNEILAQEIRQIVIEKQLNILIGSGCSAESMPLMSNYGDLDQDERNDRIIHNIIRISKLSLMTERVGIRARNTNIWKKVVKNQASYTKFVCCIVDLLNRANSRQVPRTANIFTTNYDLYIEMAVNKIQPHHRFVFNDGANGYFERILDSTNYNRVVAYKGLNDNYISEIPSINLIKSHGSVNWKIEEDNVIVLDKVYDSPMVVPPTGYESQKTFLNNYFHDMLRVFQLELDKPQSVLLVIGFSFQDQHIAKMINRALQNPELIVYVFVFRGQGNDIRKNLKREELPSNLKIILPSMIFSQPYIDSLLKEELVEKKEEIINSVTFNLDNLSEILLNPEFEIEITEDEKNEK